MFGLQFLAVKLSESGKKKSLIKRVKKGVKPCSLGLLGWVWDGVGL